MLFESSQHLSTNQFHHAKGTKGRRLSLPTVKGKPQLLVHWRWWARGRRGSAPSFASPCPSVKVTAKQEDGETACGGQPSSGAPVQRDRVVLRGRVVVEESRALLQPCWRACMPETFFLPAAAADRWRAYSSETAMRAARGALRSPSGSLYSPSTVALRSRCPML